MADNNTEICTQCPKQCPKDALECGKGRRFFSCEENPEKSGERHARPEGEHSDLTHLFMKCAHILKLKTGKSRGDGTHKRKGKHHHGHHQHYEHELNHKLSEADLFGMLSAEEREGLQNLLIKVVSHWSQKYHNQEGRHVHGSNLDS